MRGSITRRVLKMRILVFGNSHLGALRKSFKKINREHKFFQEHTFDFAGVTGKNFNAIKEVQNKPEIIFPEKFLGQGIGIKKNMLKEDNLIINTCNFAMYDVVIWSQGVNLIQSYHSMFGGSKELRPALLTKSLTKILFEQTLKKNRLFSNLRLKSPDTNFLYVGGPIRFAYKKIVDKKKFSDANLIHQKNIKYMRETLFDTRKQEGLVMSPAACIHSSGLFSLEKFALDITQDTGHAGIDYGSHLWKEIFKFIE